MSSVKLMTTEQIHTNLATVHNMWAGGIPPEQVDQVNALKSELKRRGVEGRAMMLPPQEQQKQADSMTLEQLQKELSVVSEAISKSPHDDTLQERFANVRFELRQRTKDMPAPPIETPPAPETNGSNGHSSMDSAGGHGVDTRPQIDVVVAQAHLQRMQDMEQLVRKHHFAKLAADCASIMLTKHDDPNGDDIENACTIGLQVVSKIFEKVGL